MRRVIGEALISMAALVILLAALMALDPRVREHVHGRAAEGHVVGRCGPYERRSAQRRQGRASWAARERGLDHAALAVFVVVATGLVVAMLRL